MSGRVLITGGTGFVGTQVLRCLQRALRVVIRRGTVSRLSPTSSEVEVIETDDLFGESAEWWRDACDGIDTVAHLAWYAEPGRYLISPRNLSCLSGTIALAEGAIAAGVRRFLGVGTCFEYDLTGGYLSTETPLKPLTPCGSEGCDVSRAVTGATGCRSRILLVSAVLPLWRGRGPPTADGGHPWSTLPRCSGRPDQWHPDS